MSQIRKDPIVERWVVMAPERASRPIDLTNELRSTAETFDPFEEGHEQGTTPEILAYRDKDTAPDSPGWTVRVVPNKFPALQSTGESQRQTDGIYESMNGVGAHEVIIECPHFESNLSRLSSDHIGDVVWAYRDRLIDLKRDPRLVHALIFKNKGHLAGASLQHAHSQLIATSVVPISIWEEMTGAEAFYRRHGRSVFHAIIEQESAARTRIVYETAGFLVVCPFASRFSYETWILPKRSSSHFEDIDRSLANELGSVLKAVLTKLERALDDPPYNYIIHSAPFDRPELPYYSWHVEILPRLTRVAGYEWGSGFYINEVLPEHAAARLRSTAVD